MPVKKKINIQYGNKELVVYPLGVLAEALGRVSRTIRQWEISGVIPETFRVPLNNEALGTMRVYTSEQIEIIVRNAEKHKIQKGKPFGATTFIEDVHKEISEYFAQLKKECM